MKLLRQLALIFLGLFLSNVVLAAHQGGTVHHKKSYSSNSRQTAHMTVAQIAMSNPNFSILAAALKKTGLDRELNDSGPFTIFAPTNAAFNKLPKGSLRDLMNDPRRLKAVLEYHVLKGRHATSDLRNNQAIETVQGHDVYITKRRGIVYVNNARVTKSNIVASNGIVDAVSSVISYAHR